MEWWNGGGKRGKRSLSDKSNHLEKTPFRQTQHSNIPGFQHSNPVKAGQLQVNQGASR